MDGKHQYAPLFISLSALVISFVSLGYISLSNNSLARAYAAAVGSALPSTSGDQCIQASTLGMVGDGSTANDAAFDTWTSSLTSRTNCLAFGPGKYRFNKPHVIKIPGADGSTASITIAGSGAEVTTLYFPNSAGLSIQEASQQHSFHLRDFSITTGTSNAGDAITLNNSSMWHGTYVAQSDITGVAIRGDDGYGKTYYWTTGVKDTYVSNINFNNDDLYFDTSAAPAYHGTGVSLSAPGSQSCYSGGPCAIGFNFDNVSFNYPNIGLSYGTNVENVTIDDSYFWNGTTGIYAPTGSIGLQQLTVSNTEFGTHCNAISTDSAIPFIQITNSNFQAGSGCSGILLGFYQGAIITNNTFIPYQNPGDTPKYGVAFGTQMAHGYPSVVDGNTFIGFAKAINLGTGSSEITVGPSNAFSGSGATTSNNGTGNTLK